MKTKYIVNCECGKVYSSKDAYCISRHNSSVYHQEYLLTGITPDERKENQRLHKNIHRHEYYLKHKDIDNFKNNCECGGTFTNANKYTHNKTKNHQQYLNDKNLI